MSARWPGGCRPALPALWSADAPLEEHCIHPVLSILGHEWEVQPSAGSHQPDYGLFADPAERDAAQAVGPAGGKAYWNHALAVGDAKVWERKLDKSFSGGAAWITGWAPRAYHMT